MARKPNLALLVWVCFASVAGKEKPGELGKTPVRAQAKLVFTPKSTMVPAPALGPPLLKAEFTPGHAQHPLGTRPWRVRQSWKLEYKSPPPMLTACRDNI